MMNRNIIFGVFGVVLCGSLLTYLAFASKPDATPQTAVVPSLTPPPDKQTPAQLTLPDMPGVPSLIENPAPSSVVFIRRATPTTASATSTPTPTPEPLWPAGRYRQLVFSNVVAERDITYKSTVHTKFITNANDNLSLVDDPNAPVDLQLNIYQPVGDTQTKRPLIIFVYGGGWWEGDRYQQEASAIDFAKRGYVTMTMDYTMMPPGPVLNPAPDPDAEIYPRIIDKSARNIYEVYSWALARKDQYRIDETRIGIGGWSAGGLISQALIHIASLPKPVGVRAVLGESNILPAGIAAAPPLGGFRQWTADFSPVSMFASYDDDVGFAGTPNDHAADCAYLDNIGHRCITITYPGSGHEMSFSEPPNQADAIDFFATYVTGY